MFLLLPYPNLARHGTIGIPHWLATPYATEQSSSHSLTED